MKIFISLVAGIIGFIGGQTLGLIPGLVLGIPIDTISGKLFGKNSTKTKFIRYYWTVFWTFLTTGIFYALLNQFMDLNFVVLHVFFIILTLTFGNNQSMKSFFFFDMCHQNEKRYKINIFIVNLFRLASYFAGFYATQFIID